jgi:biotin carboxylase
MTSKPIAIVLGGTNPHIALIENLKNRGYYTILFDYLENPPAKRFADEHIKESTLDKEKVYEIAKQLKASLVISACIDQANAIACYVAEKLGLPKPYSYETAINVTDKVHMKKIMLDNNIPTASFVSIKKFNEIDFYNIKFPVVVKPSDCTGSKGIRKANTQEELKEYFDIALEISRNKKVIIEEFIEGIEVQIDCFIDSNRAHVIMVRKKNQMKLNGNFAMQSIGSSIPAEVSSTLFWKIERAADAIAVNFKINNSTLFIQAIVDKNEDLKIVEFAPRVGGGLSYRLIELYTGIDIINLTIDSFLKRIPTFKIQQNYIYLESVIIYANGGVFNKITGHENLIKEKTIEEFFMFVTQGMIIGSDMSTRSRIGAFIVKADTKKELRDKIRNAIDKLQVYDVNEQPLMRKDIYNIYS